MAGLADVPFYGAYRQVGLENEVTRPAAELQQVQSAMGLMGALQKQRQEAAFRDAISQAKTPEEQAAVAARFAGPEGILKHQDNLARIKANKEATLARLAQDWARHEATHELRLRALTRQEDRDAETRRHNLAREAYEQAALRMTGERLFYDTGQRVSVPETPISPVGPSRAFDPATSPLPAGVPESDRAAYMIAKAGGSAVADRQLTPEEIGRMAVVPISFVPVEPPRGAPVPMPSPADGAPTVPMPDWGTLDARDLRLRATPPTSTPAPTIPPMPPEIAASPKRVQDQWRREQAAAAARATQPNPEKENREIETQISRTAERMKDVMPVWTSAQQLNNILSQFTPQNVPGVGYLKNTDIGKFFLTTSGKDVASSIKLFGNSVLKAMSGAAVTAPEEIRQMAAQMADGRFSAEDFYVAWPKMSEWVNDQIRLSTAGLTPKAKERFIERTGLKLDPITPRFVFEKGALRDTSAAQASSAPPPPPGFRLNN